MPITPYNMQAGPALESISAAAPTPPVELIDYFIKLGLTPEVAVSLAMKTTTLSQPTPPAANGLKMDPRTSMVNLLVDHYGINPGHANSLAGKLMNNHPITPEEQADKDLKNDQVSVIMDSEDALKFTAGEDKARKMAEFSRSSGFIPDYDPDDPSTRGYQDRAQGRKPYGYGLAHEQPDTDEQGNEVVHMRTQDPLDEAITNASEEADSMKPKRKNIKSEIRLAR